MTRGAPTEIADVLAVTSIETLLRTAYSLTHKMHAVRDLNLSADLRAQRDLITAEIIRRTTEGA